MGCVSKRMNYRCINCHWMICRQMNYKWAEMSKDHLSPDVLPKAFIVIKCILIGLVVMRSRCRHSQG